MQTGEYQGFASRFPRGVWRPLTRWAWPLGISLLVHALWLWPAAPRVVDTTGQHGDATLQAELRRPAASAAPAPTPQQGRAGAEPVVLPKRAAAAPGPHARAPLPLAPSASAPAAAQRTPPPAASTDLAGGSVAHIGAAAAPLVASRGLDAGAVRAYRIGLARQLTGLRDSLQAAAAGNVRNAVVRAKVGIAVDAAGFVERVEIVESSGHAPLDAQLQAAVRQAATAAAVPTALQGQAFVIVLELDAP